MSNSEEIHAHDSMSDGTPIPVSSNKVEVYETGIKKLLSQSLFGVTLLLVTHWIIIIIIYFFV